MAAETKLAAVPSPDVASELAARLERVRRAQRHEGTISLRARRAALDRLARALVEHKDSLVAAIDADFNGRSHHESLIAEIFTSIKGLRHTHKHLAEWMRPQRRSVGLLFQPARAEVRYQALGVVGIISPWNYPVYLAIGPIAAAIGAGNRVMLKPSEHTPRTSQALAQLLDAIFPRDYVDVVTGGPEVGRAFSALPFDHLLFTGSTEVGRHVMRAASANLTPVTLELGGKSPAIVGENARFSHAVTSIARGKLLNAGQTCIAPDYALVPSAQLERFVDAMRDTVATLYPTLGDNRDYSAIINAHHHQRLRALLADAEQKGARLVPLNPAGEDRDALGNKIAPTLVLDVNDEMQIMREEIFGPLLPVLPYRDLGEALDHVNARPRPLALYLFDERREVVDRVLDQTISGGVCVNDTLVHIAPDDLPFGGVGDSGMGHYHGFDGFETFSKKKPIFHQSRFSALSMMAPPYGKLVERLLGWLIR
ncbi:MAG: coniferyl aldehyde dehydrogenase [Myxococcales bacterium]|nr:coniferyl aldehyde dehydrogenase [Myxococcales bacterium]